LKPHRWPAPRRRVASLPGQYWRDKDPFLHRQGDRAQGVAFSLMQAYSCWFLPQRPTPDRN